MAVGPIQSEYEVPVKAWTELSAFFKSLGHEIQWSATELFENGFGESESAGGIMIEATKFASRDREAVFVGMLFTTDSGPPDRTGSMRVALAVEDYFLENGGSFLSRRVSDIAGDNDLR